MSATEIRMDWRYRRAFECVKAIIEAGDGNVDFAHYADIFEWESDETQELFEQVCRDIGVPMNVNATGPTLN